MADGDGLLNTWEQIGIDVNNDGVIGLVEPKADPLHKNHYVEIDQMVNHGPIAGDRAFGPIQDVRSAFSRSPVFNPDELQTNNKKKNEEIRRYYLLLIHSRQ